MQIKLAKSNSESSLVRGEAAAEALKQRFKMAKRPTPARTETSLFGGLEPDEAFDRLPRLIADASDLLTTIADYADVADAVARLREAPGREAAATRKPDRRNLSDHDRAAMDLLAAISLRVEALRILQRAIVELTEGRTAGGKINTSTANDLVGADVRGWRERSGEDLGSEFLDKIRGIDSSEPSALRRQLDGMVY